MADSTDRRADTTRGQILRAAAEQFARRPYHEVGLDDILAVARLTKGAMYFHFRSKHALAMAVVEEHLARDHTALHETLERKHSALETLIDVCYRIAVQDICDDLARAVLRLLPAIGWTDGLQTRLTAEWMASLAQIVERAIGEGDVVEQCHPLDVARLGVSLYMGLRQSGDLDEPEQFLPQLERCWAMVLAGIAAPDRLDYFQQFISRRTALAIRATAVPARSVGLVEVPGS